MFDRLSITTFSLLLLILLSKSGFAIRAGKPIRLKEAPWQISLQRKNFEGHWEHFCGGSIIQPKGNLARRSILTAAHCVESLTPEDLVNGNLLIKAGGSGSQGHLLVMPPVYKVFYHQSYLESRNNFTKWIEANTGSLDRYSEQNDSMETMRVLEFQELKDQHLNHKSFPLNNDIALIILSDDIPFSSESNILPIELAQKSDLNELQEVFITGWGEVQPGLSPDILQAGLVYFNNCSEKSIFCSHYLQENSDTFYLENGLQGSGDFDSGGPAFIFNEKEEKYQLIGITSYSWSNSFFAPLSGDFYVNTSDYHEWIQHILEENKPSQAYEIEPFLDSNSHPNGLLYP